MLTSTYSLTKSFATKEVTILDNENKDINFKIILKTVRDFYEDEEWNSTYHIWTLEDSSYSKMIKMIDVKNCYEFLKVIIFVIGGYKEFEYLKNIFKKTLISIIPCVDFDTKNREIILKDGKKSIIMTEEIWNYVLYVLKLSCGEKIEPPIKFVNAEAEAMYRAQKEAEEKVRRIKANSSDKNGDGMIKTLLSITYAFPSMTIDYLFDQTLAQIHWLSKNAAASVSYNINMRTYAAGNMKKGYKLDFFIK